MDEDAVEAAQGLLGLSPSNLVPPPPISLIPLKRKQPSSPAHDDAQANVEAIRCICGSSFDDGFSIACDECSRWCHAACFDIVDGEVPEEWWCIACKPRYVDVERAMKMQQERALQRQLQEEEQEKEKEQAALGKSGHRRKTSPGVERKPRRVSAIDTGSHNKRKRRSSTAVPPSPMPQEDEHIDIGEPWSHSYIHITQDIIPNQDTRIKLRQQAAHWRGITALSPSDDPATPAHLDGLPGQSQTTIQPLPPTSFDQSYLSLNADPSILPPSYAVHTTVPISSRQFIAPYTSTILPSSAYLSDPLNAYAHLGMPKPFVHFVGPPLDVALDSRITGDETRYVRSGCKPNAVLRPIICNQARASSSKARDGDDEECLTFGVFSLRDLKANEEVVLGWEWDDGHVVHDLPTLISCPHMFPPSHLQHVRLQMSDILHSLGSTFTTCACGAKARDCAVAQMEAFVEQQENGTPLQPPEELNLGPLIGRKRGFKTREKVPWSGGMGGLERVDRKGKGKAEDSDVDMDHEDSMARSASPDHRRAFPERHRYVVNGRPALSFVASHIHPRQDEGGGDQDNPVDAEETEEEEADESDSPSECEVPPKLRKRWMQEPRSGPNAPTHSIIEDKMDLDVTTSPRPPEPALPPDKSPRVVTNDMPPPPMPASIDPTTVSSTNARQQYKNTSSPNNNLDTVMSPSVAFSNLSICSPGTILPTSFVLGASNSPPSSMICQPITDGRVTPPPKHDHPSPSFPPPPHHLQPLHPSHPTVSSPSPQDHHVRFVDSPGSGSSTRSISLPPESPPTMEVDGEDPPPEPQSLPIPLTPASPSPPPATSEESSTEPEPTRTEPLPIPPDPEPVSQPPHEEQEKALSLDVEPPPPAPSPPQKARSLSVEPQSPTEQPPAMLPEPVSVSDTPTMDVDRPPSPVSAHPQTKAKISLQDYLKRKRLQKEGSGHTECNADSCLDHGEHPPLDDDDGSGNTNDRQSSADDGKAAKTSDAPTTAVHQEAYVNGHDKGSTPRTEPTSTEKAVGLEASTEKAYSSRVNVDGAHIQERPIKPLTNGHSRPTSPVKPGKPVLNGKTPSSLRVAAPSPAAKIEVIEQPLPILRQSDGLSMVTPSKPSLTAKVPIRRDTISPPSQPRQHARQDSEEDGEIISTPAPSAPASVAPIPNAKQKLPPLYAPRNHTPPTQPRSFNNRQVSPSLLNMPTNGTQRRPSVTSSGASLPSNSPRHPSTTSVTTPAQNRAPPSGPRALRAGNGNAYPYTPPGRATFSNGPFIPRGPSADWDRDRYPPAAPRNSSGGNLNRTR